MESRFLNRHIFKVIVLTFCVTNVFSQEIGDISKQLGHGYDFDGNGKDLNAERQDILYQLWPDSYGLLEAIRTGGDETIRALRIQKAYLALKNRLHNYANISFSDKNLLEVADKLVDLIGKEGRPQNLKLYRIKGEDGKGNVHFTAYYTPVLEARMQADTVFKYPVYQKPQSWGVRRPTRAMIDGDKVLAGHGLEIAWTSSLLENYFMQVQGSGYLRFEDGSLLLLLFTGQNGYAYSSIGKYLVGQGYIDALEISLHSIRDWFKLYPDSLESVLNLNKSYAFFSLSDEIPRGTANTELISGHSIAVDPRYIPLGAVLLAKIPVLGGNGKTIRHEYRLVTAQDQGGAIKGPGHVDLYEGVGENALKKAGLLHHYGVLWLILPE